MTCNKNVIQQCWITFLLLDMNQHCSSRLFHCATCTLWLKHVKLDQTAYKEIDFSLLVLHVYYVRCAARITTLQQTSKTHKTSIFMLEMAAVSSTVRHTYHCAVTCAQGDNLHQHWLTRCCGACPTSVLWWHRKTCDRIALSFFAAISHRGFCHVFWILLTCLTSSNAAWYLKAANMYSVVCMNVKHIYELNRWSGEGGWQFV